MKLQAGSQEAGFLTPICPLNSTPAIVVIKNATVQANLQSAEVSSEDLQTRLLSLFGSTEQAQQPEPQQPTSSEAPPPPSASATHAEQDSPPPEATGSGLGYLDLQPSEGRFRLPQNAYDALRSHTQSLVDDDEPASKILNSQLSLLERLPIFRDEVKRMRDQSSPSMSESVRDRLLRLPASAIKAQSKPPAASSDPHSSAGQPVYSNRSPTSETTSVPALQTSEPQSSSTQPPTYSNTVPEPPTYSSSQHQTQRSDYVRQQKDREKAQRDERERIKAQIKADREERRRQEEVRKMNEAADDPTLPSPLSSEPKPKSTDVRLQVRTFDGSTLRTSFQPTSSITSDVRPWIDNSTESNVPYNLKLILTPLPNRTIETSEEGHALTDLGIQRSCTMVMVPVKGYVESYTGNTSTGLIGSVVSGGYGLVTGTAGALFGGVRSMLGYGAAGQESQGQTSDATPATANADAAQRNMRVRTLADQRSDERQRGDQQFYNGNALNFAPNRDDRDDEDGRKND